MKGLYLFHFEPRYLHAGHYLGWSEDIERRAREHFACGRKSSPLVRAALANGRVGLVRVWPDGSRILERRLKTQGGLSRHCPVCRQAGRYHR